MGHNYVWAVKGGGCGKKSSSLRGDGKEKQIPSKDLWNIIMCHWMSISYEKRGLLDEDYEKEEI